MIDGLKHQLRTVSNCKDKGIRKNCVCGIDSVSLFLRYILLIKNFIMLLCFYANKFTVLRYILVISMAQISGTKNS